MPRSSERAMSRGPRPTVFFFNDTATTEIYTLSLHDALPISTGDLRPGGRPHPLSGRGGRGVSGLAEGARSEEHTSELQSPCNLVCRLLLEKKKRARWRAMSTNRESPAILSSIGSTRFGSCLQ